MTQQISVEGIACYAYHGCLPEEAIIGCRYTVDVYVNTDVSKSFSTDQLSDTVDYGMINTVVHEQMAIKSALIEHVAHRISTEILKRINKPAQVKVCVNKFNPPVDGQVHKTSFSLTSGS